MKNLFKALAAVIMFAALVAGTAGAEGNIRVGQMEIHPFVSLQEIFSDNIYSTSTDVKSDSITQTTPGIKAQLPIRMHRIEAEYWAIDRRYGTYGGEDTTDHHAKGLADLKFGSYVSLSASGAFDKGHEPRSSSASGFIEEFRTNTGYGSLTYQLTGKSKVQAEYTQTSWNFMTSNFRDRDEGLVSGYFYYRVMPKTWTFVQLDRKKVDFTDPASLLDNTDDSALIGMQWDITAKSKGTVKVGRQRKEFTDAALNSAKVVKPRWYLSIEHRFTEDSSLVLTGLRQINDTNSLGVAYFTTTGLFAEFSHRFMTKTAFLLRGSQGTDKYSNAVAPETTVREDTMTMYGAGLRYYMKDWIDLGADYNNRNRDSNINANDYRETQYILSLNMSF